MPAGSERHSRADAAWSEEDAGAHFDELVTRARSEGPQFVLRQGRRMVAVVDADELVRLRGRPDIALVPFPESLDLGGLDLTRDRGEDRDPLL